jgi:YidC/Oxa1 family membrane protein insertase
MLRKDLRHDICPSINPPQVANPKPCGASDASQFFFIHDITNAAHGGVLITLIVLYVGSQLLSSVFMSTTADRNQRLIMMGLPFFFVPFVIRFPAGLLVYWITTNLWTVGQGLVIRRLSPHPVPAATAAKDGGSSRGSPGGLLGAARAMGLSNDRGERAQQRDGNGASVEKPERAERSARAAPPPPPRKKKKRSGRRR